VAIPLRENARIYSLNSIPLMPQEVGWKIASTNALKPIAAGTSSY
jgi:hypothetical protein